MRFIKIVAAAGLALPLVLTARIASAQLSGSASDKSSAPAASAPSGSSGSMGASAPAAAASTGSSLSTSPSSSGPSLNAGSNAAVVPSEASPTAMNKSFDTLAPQQQATQLALDITNAKALGKDVKAAEQHQVLGEKALKSGETASASKHFKEAEEALGMNSSSTSPSSMAPS